MPEDPETYRKRMETRHRNEEHKIQTEPGWTDDGRRTNMRYLQEKRQKTNAEYKRRKAAAAASTASAGSSSSCWATYPDQTPEANAVVDVLTPVVFAVVAYVVIMLGSWARRRTR